VPTPPAALKGGFGATTARGDFRATTARGGFGATTARGGFGATTARGGLGATTGGLPLRDHPLIVQRQISPITKKLSLQPNLL